MPHATGVAHGVAVTSTVLSMGSVQLSDALSVPLIDGLGSTGTASLRMTLGAVLLLVVVRPAVRTVTRGQWAAVVPLGAALAVLGVACMAAFEHLPLGRTAAIAFLGPLTVALVRGGRHGAPWAVAALAGVAALTEPWGASASSSGHVLGVVLALVAAAAWAACIVLTGLVGARLPGLDGIALALPVSALCVAPFGFVQAAPGLSVEVVGQGLALAVLMPVLPCVLELVALRRIPQHVFATLMSLEPALAAVAGAVVLGQHLPPLPVAGLLLVVVAGVGATAGARSGAGVAPGEPVLVPLPVPLPVVGAVGVVLCSGAGQK